MQPNGQGGENRASVRAALAVQRFAHALEAAAHGDAVAGQQRKLGRPVSKAFQRGEPIHGRNLADGVHLLVDVERRVC